jgi:transcriptional regulator with XRE-family HTH domain
MTDTAVGSSFGQRLRRWRTQRGLSQLALANSAGTTPRHVSFLETGRSRPQRDIVLRLGDALALPLREINAMLQAAGLTPSFAHQPWQAADLAPFRAAIDTMLAAHLPYPALVLDSHTTVLQVNAACDRLFGPGLVASNFVRDVLSSPHIAGCGQLAASGLGGSVPVACRRRSQPIRRRAGRPRRRRRGRSRRA